MFEDVIQNDYVYCTKENKHASKSAIDNVFKRLKLSTNITDVRCSPHTFRHTFSKDWILGGVVMFIHYKEYLDIVD